MTDRKHPDALAPIFAELDALREAIEALQSRCDGGSASLVRLADPAPNVRRLHCAATIPGDAWQTLEALRGLTWAVRKLAEEVGKGGAHD